MNRKILLVEDEPDLGETLKEYLCSHNYPCDLASSYSQGLTQIKKHRYHIGIFDIGLPDGNGMELAKAFRQLTPHGLIIFLSALNDPETRLSGLEIGAQDYITKPFKLKELMLRLHNIEMLHDKISTGPSCWKLGTDYRFYPKKFELQYTDQQTITLSQKEAAILYYFIKRTGEVVSRDDIIDEVWGTESYPSQRTVDNYIVSLRKCLSQGNQQVQIQSIRGIGYKLESQTEITYE